MTNEQILELAKICGFKKLKDVNNAIKIEYEWWCWEEQLLKFALAIHEDGYNKGYDECSIVKTYD
jgi:hypothetical protein